MFDLSKRSLQDLKLIQITSWQKKSRELKDEMLDYNWEYRKKVCAKCPIETQIRLNCHKIDNFKNGIQETHCKKLIRARTKKFRKKIDGLLLSYT